MTRKGVHVVCHSCPFEGVVLPHDSQLREVDERAADIVDGHLEVRPEHKISSKGVPLE